MLTMRNFLLSLFCFLILCYFYACGGGGGSGISSVNKPSPPRAPQFIYAHVSFFGDICQMEFPFRC